MKHALAPQMLLGCMVALGCGSATSDGTSAASAESSGGGSATEAETTGGTTGSDTNASMSASATNVTVSTTAGSSEEGGEEGPSPVKLDVLGLPDAPGAGPCGGKGKGGDEPDFSFIWVANSSEGTVSKINTVTLEEEGRYRTRMDAGGSPSRTSVSLNGDVAVANRTGGVVKIAARLESCPDDSNTSSGAADVKPFPDGCVVWFTPFAYTSQRPVAWAPGEWSDASCSWENEMLWTSGAQGEAIEVLLLNGEDGVVEETIPVPGVSAGYFGIYGAASDADGNFWGTQLGGGTLVNVDRNSFELRTWAAQGGGYGMTVDTEGRTWTCSSGVARFDPETETWATNNNVGGGGGCMVDAEGRLWLGGYTGGGQLIAVDTETLQVVEAFQIPNYVHGVSIDFYGYVWGVTHSQPFAYRLDPTDGTFETFMGLNGPYTYSDMTGWALSNVVGGTPSG